MTLIMEASVELVGSVHKVLSFPESQGSTCKEMSTVRFIWKLERLFHDKIFPVFAACQLLMVLLVRFWLCDDGGGDWNPRKCRMAPPKFPSQWLWMEPRRNERRKTDRPAFIHLDSLRHIRKLGDGGWEDEKHQTWQKTFLAQKLSICACSIWL